MKTIVTFILACTTTICLGQETNGSLNVSQDTKEELKLVFQTLAQKLEDINQKEFFTRPEFLELQTKMAEANSRINNSFEASHFSIDSLNPKVSRNVRFSVHLDDASTALAQLEHTDFTVLEKKLDEIATAIEKSPKITELALRLKKLEEQYKSTDK